MAFPWMAIPAVLGGISAAKGLFGGNKGSKTGGYDDLTGAELEGGGGGSSLLGGIGNVLGGIGNWSKKNPLAILMGASMLGSIPESSANRKLTGAQRLLLEQQLRDMQRRSEMQEMARQALGRVLSAGPYAKSMPNVSDIYGSK